MPWKTRRGRYHALKLQILDPCLIPSTFCTKTGVCKSLYLQASLLIGQEMKTLLFPLIQLGKQTESAICQQKGAWSIRPAHGTSLGAMKSVGAHGTTSRGANFAVFRHFSFLMCLGTFDEFSPTCYVLKKKSSWNY